MRSTPQVIGAARDQLAQPRAARSGPTASRRPRSSWRTTRSCSPGRPGRGSPAPRRPQRGSRWCCLSERQLNRLTNRPVGQALAFLTQGAGMLGSCSTPSTRRRPDRRAEDPAPALIQSIPAAADQEDFVSIRRMNTATQDPASSTTHTACSASSSWRRHSRSTSASSRRRFVTAKAKVRRHVDFLDEGATSCSATTTPCLPSRENRILDAVESEIGPLATY